MLFLCIKSTGCDVSRWKLGPSVCSVGLQYKEQKEADMVLRGSLCPNLNDDCVMCNNLSRVKLIWCGLSCVELVILYSYYYGTNRHWVVCLVLQPKRIFSFLSTYGSRFLFCYQLDGTSALSNTQNSGWRL